MDVGLQVYVEVLMTAYTGPSKGHQGQAASLNLNEDNASKLTSCAGSAAVKTIELGPDSTLLMHGLRRFGIARRMWIGNVTSTAELVSTSSS